MTRHREFLAGIDCDCRCHRAVIEVRGTVLYTEPRVADMRQLPTALEACTLCLEDHEAVLAVSGTRVVPEPALGRRA